jgi:cytosine/adenosine deaminase-related metal-dependent hydrolase
MIDADTNRKTPEQLRARRVLAFVRDVAAHKDGCTPHKLRTCATREEDKARQAARKLGLVKFENGRWKVMPKGLVWIEQPE